MDTLKAIIFILLVICTLGVVCIRPMGLESLPVIYESPEVLESEQNCSKISQCDSNQYEVTLSLAKVNKISGGRISCFLNRNGQIRHYVCLKCSVCESLAVLLECGRKHDTICSSNCTNPDAVYDVTQKRCISNATAEGRRPPTSLYYTSAVQLTVPVKATVIEIDNNEKHPRIRPMILITALSVVNVSMVTICSLIIIKRRKSQQNQLSIKHLDDIPSATTNEAYVSHVSVVSEENHNLVSDNRHIMRMSLGGTPAPRAVKSNSKPPSSCEPFWLQMKAMVGSEGGIVSDSRSSVSLIIPPGAIPENHGKQEIIVRVSLKPSMFGLNKETDRHLLSPVVECLSPGLNGFDSCVTLVVPHRAELDPDWKFQVLHSEEKYPVSKSGWTVTNYRSTETNGVQFEVDERFFRIKTTHFTTYACTGCHRKAPLCFEVVVYGSYSDFGNRQRVDLRCYVGDRIKDYHQQIRQHESTDPLCIPRPIVVDKKTKQIKITLPEEEFGPDWQWTSETFKGSLPCIRNVDVTHAIRCCLNAMSHYESFTLKPKETHTRLDFLEATMKVITNGDEAVVVGPIRMNTTTTVQNNSPRHQWTDIVSTEKLEAVSEEIPNGEWKPVYRTLHALSKFTGSAETDINNIQHGHQGQIREIKYQILLLWRSKAGRRATTQILIQALKNCELNLIVFNHFQVETHI